MNTTADEVRASALLRSMPWLLFAAGFCLIIVGGIATEMSAYEAGRVAGQAMLMLLPINILGYVISRFVRSRLLASTCAGVVFVVACAVLLAAAPQVRRPQPGAGRHSHLSEPAPDSR